MIARAYWNHTEFYARTTVVPPMDADPSRSNACSLTPIERTPAKDALCQAALLACATAPALT